MCPSQSLEYSERHHLIFISTFETGVVALDASTGKPMWHLKQKGVYKMRLSEDEQSLSLCRASSVTVIVVECKSGQTLEKWSRTSDLCMESVGGRSVALLPDKSVQLDRGEDSAIAEWGTFAIHSYCFREDEAFLTGPASTIARYSFLNPSLHKRVATGTFEKCTSLILSEIHQGLVGVLFEPDGVPIVSIVKFNPVTLEPSETIRSFELASEVVLFGGGQWALVNTGELYDLTI